jgi:hypothetical protein
MDLNWVTRPGSRAISMRRHRKPHPETLVALFKADALAA